ncbi:MAG: tail fiber domain-containing protein [Bacteroidales bacterium]|nr:tail fiber domain-containing protein [Bacteroidales bacterium]
MKTLKTTIFVTFLLFVSSGYAQLTLDNRGTAFFGNFDTVGKGISVTDSYTSSSAVPLKMVRTSNNRFYFKRNDANRGVYLNNQGMLRVGTDINGYTYESDAGTPLGIVSDASQAIDMYLMLDGTYGMRIWHTGLYNDAIAVFHRGNLRFQVSGAGNVYGSGFFTLSDVSRKKDIENIPGALSKVMQLRGVVYSMNSPEETLLAEGETGAKFSRSLEESYSLLSKQKPELSLETFRRMEQEKSRKRIGVVAQEVEAVVPEVVRTREDGLKAVAYQELVGLLIEAMKEQQGRIDALSLEVAELKLGQPVLKSSEKTTAGTTIDPVLSGCILSQNTPNPFTSQTEIRYFLPGNNKEAFIGVFDMQGKMILKEEAVPGNHSITIPGSSLPAGMYVYSLVVGGQVMDTKQMVLTK